MRFIVYNVGQSVQPYNLLCGSKKKFALKETHFHF